MSTSKPSPTPRLTIPHPATQPRSGRHEFGQHREQEAGDHIRHKRAHNERRPANRRQKHINACRQPTPTNPPTNTTTYISPSASGLNRACIRFIGARGIVGGSMVLAAGAVAPACVLNSVDCLRDRMRVLTRSHHVSRRLFLRFHCAPPVLAFRGQRCSHRPCNN